MNPSAYLGIEPCQGGAVALLSKDGEAHVADYPGDPHLLADLLLNWRTEYRIKLAALEHVHSMPGQGVASVFAFGRNAGIWEGVLAGLGIPFILVKPRQWQSGVLLKQDGPDTKSQSLAAARRRWPDLELGRKKDHGRADALHLAAYAKAQDR
jgi:hypothetical protein